MDLKKYLDELKERKVIRAGIGYLVCAWIIIQVLSIVLPELDAPEHSLKIVIIILILGFPNWIMFSWIYDITQKGIIKTKLLEINNQSSSLFNKKVLVILFLISLAISFKIGYDIINEHGAYNLDTESQKLDIVIENSLLNSFSGDEIRIRLLQQLENIFPNFIDIYDISQGDKMNIVYNKFYQIEALRFVKENFVKEYFYFNNNDQEGYYDKHGYSLENKFLKTPIPLSNNVISKYNYYKNPYGLRAHPIYEKKVSHLGTDYFAQKSTPVFAVGSGIVKIASYSSNNGNYIKIRHDSIFESQYLHLSEFAEEVNQGKEVSKGEIIGYVGSTGMATEPHLCLRFWKNSEQVDPREFDFPSINRLDNKQLGIYHHYLDSLKSDKKLYDNFKF